MAFMLTPNAETLRTSGAGQGKHSDELRSSDQS